MLDLRREQFLCLESMFLIAFCHLVGKAEDGPYVSELHEHFNDAIVLYIISVVYRHAICGPH